LVYFSRQTPFETRQQAAHPACQLVPYQKSRLPVFHFDAIIENMENTSWVPDLPERNCTSSIIKHQLIDKNEWNRFGCFFS
jgi:hypothetical protein